MNRSRTNILNHSLPTWLKYASFSLFLGIVIFLFEIPELFFSHPQGIHFTRQTDTLSFVHHYLLNGMNFLEPGILSKNSIDGNVACEFPLFYYLIALISMMGLKPYLVMRALSLGLTAAALFSIYRTCLHVVKNIISSLSLTFLLFSSCVWVYYANGFSPDSMAMSLSLIGLSGFYRLDHFDSPRVLIGSISVICLTLAALLKLTFAIYPIAIIMTLYWTRRNGSKTPNCPKRSYYRLLLLGLLLSCLWWFLIVPRYNASHLDYYFLTSSAPIWSLDKEQIQIVWDHVSEWWLNSYYYPQVIHFIGICLVLFGVFYRQMDKKFRKLILLSILGCVAYFILFYRQFRDHDYYALVFGPAVFILFLELARWFSIKFKERLALRYLASIALATLTIVSSVHGSKKFKARYGDPTDYFAWIGFKMNGIAEYLDSIGIERHDDLLVVGDLSPNGGLYFAERMGWSVKDLSPSTLEKTTAYISGGLRYILVANSEIELPERISDSIMTEIGNYNGVKVYMAE